MFLFLVAIDQTLRLPDGGGPYSNYGPMQPHPDTSGLRIASNGFGAGAVSAIG